MKKTTSAQNTNSKQTGYVSAVEAATQAGAAYVRKAAYAKGRSDGWDAGWKAAISRGTARRSVDENPQKPHAVSAPLDEPENEEPEKEPPQFFELTEECARLFARSMKARKRQKQSHRDSPSCGVEQLDLGGLMEKRRRHQAMKTYGADARQIAEIEAELSAHFGRIVSDTGANYWPVVPLRDGERPMERVMPILGALAIVVQV